MAQTSKWTPEPQLVAFLEKTVPSAALQEVEDAFREHWICSVSDLQMLSNSEWVQVVPFVALRNRLRFACENVKAPTEHSKSRCCCRCVCYCLPLLVVIGVIVISVTPHTFDSIFHCATNIHGSNAAVGGDFIEVIADSVQIDKVKSEGTNSPVYATFVNKCNRPVSVYWKNFQKGVTFYATIPADGSWSVTTYVHHWWIVFPAEVKDVKNNSNALVAFDFDWDAANKRISVEVKRNWAVKVL